MPCLGHVPCTHPSLGAEQEIARDIKECLSAVAMEYEQQLQQPEDFKEYQLPDGQVRGLLCST